MPSWSPQQQYKFTGRLYDPDEPQQGPLSFYVLAGTGAPTATDGYAQIQVINRARRKGFTIASGYNPMGMQVPIRFDATVSSNAYTPAQLERDILTLEWMGGRGKLYSNGTHPAHGNPPIVQVSSFKDGGRTSTNLIPPNLHSDAAGDLRWLVANIQWDQNPIRGPEGDRLQQDAVVSLTEYVAAPGEPVSPRARQQGRGASQKYRSVTATQALDTIHKICLHVGLRKAEQWNQVVAFNLPRLHVRSWHQHLNPGTVVQIPISAFGTGGIGVWTPGSAVA